MYKKITEVQHNIKNNRSAKHKQLNIQQITEVQHNIKNNRSATQYKK
jgi:hypothetical protein